MSKYHFFIPAHRVGYCANRQAFLYQDEDYGRDRLGLGTPHSMTLVGLALLQITGVLGRIHVVMRTAMLGDLHSCVHKPPTWVDSWCVLSLGILVAISVSKI